MRDALAIGKFKDADIIIPISVIEEVDRFKRDMGENGRNARQFSRFIDVLRNEGPLANGVPLKKSNAILFVNIDAVFEKAPWPLAEGARGHAFGTAETSA